MLGDAYAPWRTPSRAATVPNASDTLFFSKENMHKIYMNIKLYHVIQM